MFNKMEESWIVYLSVNLHFDCENVMVISLQIIQKNESSLVIISLHFVLDTEFIKEEVWSTLF